MSDLLRLSFFSFSYMKEIEVDGVMATLEITVTAGQEEFQALLEPVLRGCDVRPLSSSW